MNYVAANILDGCLERDINIKSLKY